MDTFKKEVAEILDFLSFIKKYFMHYEVDGNNIHLIQKLGLWANRDEKFNNSNEGYHIDRGIILSGPVGAGKDELFELLKKYLTYLRSPYKFISKVVWEFAKPFQEDGYSCFDEQTGNIYYEELALTDERTQQPTREYVSHFGTKLLIGAEIINIRHKVFMKTAWQTHFSTNLNENQLAEVYGQRCISRLYEMCNFLVLPGVDRRGKVVPVFKKNKNQPPAPPAPVELDPAVEKENKEILEGGYRFYLERNILPEESSLIYNVLCAYGVEVCTEDEMRACMIMAEPGFNAGLFNSKSKGDLERLRKEHIWKASRELAVRLCYEKLKVSGAKSIFGEINLNMKAVEEKIIKTKK